MTRTLILYTRAGCPLCEEMAAAAEGLLAGHAVGIATVDVDADPVLKARYGWDVPLLFDGGTELGRHRLDPAAIRAWLAAQA
ncbi:glutaredoxin family protein [Betaproteobacteria bacterium SCN1]|nr:glutaredoxin family protein [Betaproteobacteria bacterium SCN1]MBN8760366.1 glutaredoxin family protein [Thiobacillus sp.]